MFGPGFGEQGRDECLVDSMTAGEKRPRNPLSMKVCSGPSIKRIF